MVSLIRASNTGETKLEHPWLHGYLLWLRTFHHRVEAQAKRVQPDKDNPMAEVWVSSWVFFHSDETTLELPWRMDLRGVRIGSYAEDMYRSMYNTMQDAIAQDQMSDADGRILDLRPYVASLMGVTNNIPGQPDIVPKFSHPSALFQGVLPTVKADVAKPIH